MKRLYQLPLLFVAVAILSILLRFYYVTSMAAAIVLDVLSIAALTVIGGKLLEMMMKPNTRRAPRISSPPGWNLRRFAEFCFSKKTFTVVLEPALSDMRHEHEEALAAGRLWKARMVLVRGYWSFWSAVAAQLPISFARRVYEVWKATKAGN